MEAKDKKGIEETTKPGQKTALVSWEIYNAGRVLTFLQVPFQPNYCDCGIYVLHFAKKFMEDPIKFTHLILVGV